MQLCLVENLTGFKHFAFKKLGADNHFYDVVIVKADLHLRSGVLQVIDAPAEVSYADHYSPAIDPLYSVVEQAADVVAFKPSTDWLMTGHAKSSDGRPSPQWLCELEVETRRERRKRRLHLHGPRYWQWSFLRGWHLSGEESVEAIPLSYTLAYGGGNPAKRSRYRANPSGVGWYKGTPLDRDARYAAPRIHYFDDPVRYLEGHVGVAGFASQARWWSSRYQYAGTYDRKWREQFDTSEHSVYPQDFDARFFQCAHPDWIFHPYLRGDETFWLTGAHAERGICAQLPSLRIQGQCLTRSGKLLSAPLPLDTVHIDLDRQTVSLVWRASLPQSLGIPLLLLQGERMQSV